MSTDCTTLGKIEKRRAVDAAHDKIREAILQRRFPPGMRLNVEGLASQLGVSLTPVRGAIQLLAAEGFVDVHSHTGTFVADLSRRDLEEMFDICCALESLASEKAVERFTNGHIARARELFEILENPAKGDNEGRSRQETNWEFHNIIVRASGNQRLVARIRVTISMGAAPLLACRLVPSRWL